jgi:hypothetical protein
MASVGSTFVAQEKRRSRFVGTLAASSSPRAGGKSRRVGTNGASGRSDLRHLLPVLQEILPWPRHPVAHGAGTITALAAPQSETGGFD